MTFNELHEEYIKMCTNNQACADCKYNDNSSCRLSFGYDKGRADCLKEIHRFVDQESYKEGFKRGIEEVKRQLISLHTDMIQQYGADIVEARCDAFSYLKEWLEEQNN